MDTKSVSHVGSFFQQVSAAARERKVRRDRVDTSGKITLRYHGRLHSIGIGRTHARTRVLVLVHDRDIRIINAAAGGLLRELVLDPTKRYQPIPRPDASR
jgi:hypothetical protein